MGHTKQALEYFSKAEREVCGVHASHAEGTRPPSAAEANPRSDSFLVVAGAGLQEVNGQYDYDYDLDDNPMLPVFTHFSDYGLSITRQVSPRFPSEYQWILERTIANNRQQCLYSTEFKEEYAESDLPPADSNCWRVEFRG